MKGEAFRALLHGLVDAIAAGLFVQEPSVCDWCDFTAVCGPKPLLAAPPRLKIARPARAGRRCACGTSDERASGPVDHAARERTRRDLAHEPRARGGRGHRQDDAARRPHRGAGPRGHRAPRPDRGRHLHRERRHHHEAAAARAARAGARRRRRAEAERERAAAALDVLERAPISTIHALCAAILQERPLECGVRARLPGGRRGARPTCSSPRPGRSGWPSASSGGDDVLLEALDRGIPLEGEGPWGERTSLRGLARVLLEQRDLVPLAAEGVVDPPAWRARAAGEGRARPRRSRPRSSEGDRLAARLETLARLRRAVALPRGPRPRRAPAARSRRPEELRPQAALALARGARRGPGDRGVDEGGAPALDGRAGRRACTAGWCARSLGVVALYETKKAERGVLDFLDLLLKARDALRDRGAVRRYFRERFRFLIIDEFQDTDPLQVEIAALLAGRPPGRPGGGGRRQAVDLPLPPRRGGALPRALRRGPRARPGPRGAAPDPELPLAARHPALRQPRLRRADPGVGRGRPAALRADRRRRPACRDEPSVVALRFAAAPTPRATSCCRRRPRRSPRSSRRSPAAA